jgi:hypothetical protein
MVDDGLSAGAVARRLGVAVTTLRTWHQRYGLGPSRHVPGHHRRYTAEDLARLEVMRRLTAQGVPPAEAARWAGRPVPAVPAAAPDAPPALGVAAAVVSAPEASSTGPRGSPTAGDVDAPPVIGRHGGGFAIPLGRATPEARGLARAAMRLDGPAMRELIARSVGDRGVVATWDTVIRPVLVGVGLRHASTAALIEVEHLVSRTVSEVFSAVPRPPAGGPPPAILLACADEEQHSLPLEALAAALAESGVACRLLGARVPPAALRDAVARTGPRAVVVWAHVRDTADPAQLAAMLTGRARPLLVVAAGPGWQPETLPDEVAAPVTLARAVAVTTAAVDLPVGHF